MDGGPRGRASRERGLRSGRWPRRPVATPPARRDRVPVPAPGAAADRLVHAPAVRAGGRALFQSWDGVGRDTPFVGLRNYERVLGDGVFWTSLWNAAVFGLIGFLVGNAISLGMAVAVSANPRGASFFRIAYYLPGVFSVVVVGLTFQWLLQPSVGLVNRTLVALGLTALKHNWRVEELCLLRLAPDVSL